MKWFRRIYISFIAHLARFIVLELHELEKFEKWKTINKSKIIRRRAILALEDDFKSDYQLFKEEVQ